MLYLWIKGFIFLAVIPGWRCLLLFASADGVSLASAAAGATIKTSDLERRAAGIGTPAMSRQLVLGLYSQWLMVVICLNGNLLGAI